MIDLDEVVEFIVDETIFLLPVLSGKPAVALQAALTEDKEIEITQKTKNVIKVGLSGIKNIKISGEVKEFVEATTEVIEKFPIRLLTKLMSKIVEINFPTEEEKKN
jgi:hypothetical protein